MESSQPLKPSVDLPDLLQALAAAQPVSGAELARMIGVSRTAIWKGINSLRRHGLPIAAQAGAGYRLAWPVELLDRQRIVACLPPPSPTIEVVWETTSTQDAMARQPGLPDMAVVLAEIQTKGRGRRGAPWLTTPGASIAFSLCKRFDHGFAALAGLSLAVGVSVVRALERLGVAEIGLAWPNDIVTAHGKLGGILTELRGEYHGPCEAIIGVGLNLRLPPASRGRIPQPATDIAVCTSGEVPNRNLLAATLIEQLARDLAQFAEAGLAGFVEDYRRRDRLAGQRVRICIPDTPVTGICQSIDSDGALLVETATGTQKIIGSRFPVRREDGIA